MNGTTAAAPYWGDRVWRAALAALTVLFVVNIALMVAAVAANSFARRWLGTWLPDGYTGEWYRSAWREFQLDAVLWVTAEVVLAVVALSILIGVPAAYTLARKPFRGRQAVMLLFLLPLVVPPMTYGIPLATVMYSVGLAGTLAGVIGCGLRLDPPWPVTCHAACPVSTTSPPGICTIHCTPLTCSDHGEAGIASESSTGSL